MRAEIFLFYRMTTRHENIMWKQKHDMNATEWKIQIIENTLRKLCEHFLWDRMLIK